ncbi:MAG: hypothetical protein M1819_004687 [Sarea resinae]|nr:MAG: hypothetical protein M1819_004687 [Sarea resinae]
MKLLHLFLLSCFHFNIVLSASPVFHFTIHRRGGAFPTEDVADLAFLTQEVAAAEARFNLTIREFKGNKVIRKARIREDSSDHGPLMGDVGQHGRWFAKLKLGDPPQETEVDLDMLTSDLFVFTTTSNKGSRFDDLWSQSYTKPTKHPHPSCGIATDILELRKTNVSVPISFAHCKPSKSSLQTLLSSGSLLGLAPSKSLSETMTPSLIEQLDKAHLIDHPIWSLSLINAHEGVFSVGGTLADVVERVDTQTKKQLDQIGGSEGYNVAPGAVEATREKRGGTTAAAKDTGMDWRSKWRWSKVQGAEGWWQILMQGAWVEKTKVLKNQPVVIDLNTPFILAPPNSARILYASISGSRPLPPPYDAFHMFPCLNPPELHFEFGGWAFPALHGERGLEWSGRPGGKFSLGRIDEGSGYCVGAIVETRMGLGSDEANGGDAQGQAMGNNGMRDVWVIGERFFWGVGGVFDVAEKTIAILSLLHM